MAELASAMPQNPKAPVARPDVMLLSSENHQPSLPLASDGVLRWVWHGRFGAMLIEVVGDAVFVNGQRVEPHPPSAGGD